MTDGQVLCTYDEGGIAHRLTSDCTYGPSERRIHPDVSIDTYVMPGDYKEHYVDPHGSVGL